MRAWLKAGPPRLMMIGLLLGLVCVPGLLSRSADTPVAPPLAAVLSADVLKQAREVWSRGNVKDAAALLLTLPTTAAVDPAVQLFIAEIYLDLVNGAAAEVALNRASGLGIAEQRLTALRARALLQQGAFDRVIEETLSDEALGLDEAVALATLRAQALLVSGRSADARAEIVDLARILPGDPRILLAQAGAAAQDRDGAAVAALVEAAAAAGVEDQQAQHALAELRVRQGRLTAAETAFGRAIDAGRYPWLSLYRRAELRRRLGDRTGALADLELVRSMYTEFPALALLKGDLASDGYDWATARDAYQTVLALNPEHAGALLGLGRAAYYLGQHEQARVALERLQALDADSDEGGALLAGAMLELGRRDEAQLLIACVLGRHDDVVDADAAPIAARVLSDLGSFDDALTLLDAALVGAPNRPDLLLAMADTLSSAGRTDDAVRRLDAAVAAAPDLALLRVHIVDLLLRAGETEPALRQARQAVADLPRLAVAQAALGTALAATGRDDEAATAFQRARQLDPNQPTAIIGLAQWRQRRGEIDAAGRLYCALIRERPERLDLLRQTALAELRVGAGAGARQGFAATLSKTLELCPDQQRLRTAVAEMELVAGDPGAAIARLGRSPGDDALSAGALQVLGRAYLAAADLDAAVKRFKAAADLAPEDAGSHYGLAMALALGESPRSAQSALLRGWDLDPRHPLAVQAVPAVLERLPEHERLGLRDRLSRDEWGRRRLALLLAEAALQTGDYRGAADAYGQLVAQQPEDAEAFQGQLAAQLGLGRLAPDGAGWRSLRPGDPAALGLLAELAVKDGEPERAVGLLKRLLSRQPSNHVALNNLAALLTKTDTEAARGYIERALTLAPGTPAYLDTLGQLQMAAGELASARQALQESYDRRPEAPSTARRLAKVLGALGERDREQAILDRLGAEGDE